MEITPFGPDDTDRLQQYVEVVNAARAVDSPWQREETLKQTEGRFRHGWDGEVETPYLGLVDGEPVAVGWVATTDYDNLHLAWLGFRIHPEHRRRGHGTAMLDELVTERVARPDLDGDRRLGRRDPACVRGSARAGAEERGHAPPDVAELDWATIERLHAEALAAATAYEIVRADRPHPR